jgi:hypothetical protein
VCCVLFGRGAVFCVLCLIVVPLPSGNNPFTLQFNNNMNNNKIIIIYLGRDIDRLCGLVVRAPGYRPRRPGSIPDAT